MRKESRISTKPRLAGVLGVSPGGLAATGSCAEVDGLADDLQDSPRRPRPRAMCPAVALHRRFLNVVTHPKRGFRQDGALTKVRRSTRRSGISRSSMTHRPTLDFCTTCGRSSTSLSGVRLGLSAMRHASLSANSEKPWRPSGPHVMLSSAATSTQRWYFLITRTTPTAQRSGSGQKKRCVRSMPPMCSWRARSWSGSQDNPWGQWKPPPLCLRP